MNIKHEIIKYLRQNEKRIVSGQDAKTGYWHCKQVETDTVEETEIVIGELNEVYNKFNEEIKKINKKLTTG